MALIYSLVLLAFTLAFAAPDWTDCPAPCRCLWTSGKQTAYCKKSGLSSIPKNLDEGMQVLDLSQNHIGTLQRAAFKSAGLLNLQRIYLSDSRIRDIHQDAFQDLIILVEVDLSNNDISSLHPLTFHGNERLRVLYLNGNPLRHLVQAQFPPLPHLRNLELEGCRLEFIHKDAFIHLTALETLNLKHNLLQNLSESAFMNFAHLKTLNLEGNPWKCDCELRGFRDWFLSSNLHSTSLACTEPEFVNAREWDTVPSEEFACPPQVFAYPQQQLQGESGGNVTFGCHVYGDPEPKVSWLYDGYPINHTWLVIEAEEGLLQKWSNITVYNVSDVDVGTYTCMARNILDTSHVNITLVLPEIVTATTLSKTDNKVVWWVLLVFCSAVVVLITIAMTVVCCVKRRNRRGGRRNLKTSVSFTDQEKKLLDVSIATTTDRGTGSSEAIGPDMDMIDPPVHITIEREPLPLVVFPPPPEFSGNPLPAGPYGNIFISVSVSRDPSMDISTRCPDLLDLPHRPKTIYHGMATLPRRPCGVAAPQYDNMGPRVTAGGSSTLSLPDVSGPVGLTELPTPLPPIAAAATCLSPPTVAPSSQHPRINTTALPLTPVTPEFVSL